MSRTIEDKTLKNLIEWIGEYRNTMPRENNLDGLIQEQVTYWMQDILTVVYYSEEFDISDSYGTEIFGASLVLKIYKLLRSLHLTYSDWNFDISNRTIDDVNNHLFLKYIKNDNY